MLMTAIDKRLSCDVAALFPHWGSEVKHTQVQMLEFWPQIKRTRLLIFFLARAKQAVLNQTIKDATGNSNLHFPCFSGGCYYEKTAEKVLRG